MRRISFRETLSDGLGKDGPQLLFLYFMITTRSIQRWHAGQGKPQEDELAVEEPLELRAHGESLAVLMRTPGHDLELVRGLLHAEGVIRAERDVLSVTGPNSVHIEMPAELLAGRWSSRDVISSAACGVCGAAALAVLEELAVPVRSDLCWSPAFVTAAPGLLTKAQETFSRTGGLHAAGLFGTDGKLVICREDVGRHNAVDKVIGWGLESGRSNFSEYVLVVSGRLSYEIVHKAVVAGIPIAISISAPSSLAVDLAERWRVTLAGFVRGETFNVYTHPHRIHS